MADSNLVTINDLPEVQTLSADAEMMVNNAATPVPASKIKVSKVLSPVNEALADMQTEVNNLSEAVATLGTIKLKKLSQAEWEALGVKDENTLYIVIQTTGTDAVLYIGNIQVM